MEETGIEIRGCGVHGGSIAIGFIFLSFLVLFIMLITPPDNILVYFIWFLLIGTSIVMFIYASTLKRIIIDEFGIRYWYGKKLRYSVYWQEILMLENRKVEDWTSSNVIRIITNDEPLVLSTDFHFQEKKLKLIFRTISVILSGRENFTINDVLGWYPERMLTSHARAPVHSRSVQRLSVTMII